MNEYEIALLEEIKWEMKKLEIANSERVLKLVDILLDMNNKTEGLSAN